MFHMLRQSVVMLPAETAHTIKLPDVHFHIWLKEGSRDIFTSTNPTAAKFGHVKHVNNVFCCKRPE